MSETDLMFAGCKQNGERSDNMHQMQRFWHMSMRQLQGVHDDPRKSLQLHKQLSNQAAQPLHK